MARRLNFPIARFYLGAADVWYAAAFTVLFLAATVLVAVALARASAPDDHAAKAAAALAWASASEKCECVKGKVSSWKDASTKALKDHVPIVVFAGDAEPRCCGSAIPVRMTIADAKLDDVGKPIVVYVPTADGKLAVFERLPATATREQIRAIVAKARKSLEK